MRVMVVGATGTIGRAIVAALEPQHEVIQVARRHGRHRVELDDPASIRALFQAAGPLDAIISAAGQAKFGALSELTDDDFALGLRNKLMGQANLVRYGMASVADGGSITVTTGILAHAPAPGSAAITPANAGLEGFIRAAALEMPRGIRVNAVSPPWISETLESMGRDPSGGLPAATVAQAYVRVLEGHESGQVFRL